MKVPLFLLMVTGLVPAGFAQPVLTEVMPKPVASDAEYAEIFNPSASDSLVLESFKLKDNLSTSGIIRVWGPKKIPPKGYAVILDRDYFAAGSSGQYNDQLPAGIPVYMTSNASIGNGLGNTTDRLALVSAAGDTASLLDWTLPANFPAGFSLECENPDGPPAGAYPGLNWQKSKVQFGTPGSPNSVPFRPLVDLELIRVNWNPDPVTEGDTLVLSAWIKNSGLNRAEGAFVTVNTPDTGPPGLPAEIPVSPPEPADSSRLLIPIPGITRTLQLNLTLSTPDDAVRSNDTLSVRIPVVVLPEGDLSLQLLTEFPEPVITGMQAEFTAGISGKQAEGQIPVLKLKLEKKTDSGWNSGQDLDPIPVPAFTGKIPVQIVVPALDPGGYRLTLVLEAAGDQDLSGNEIRVEFEVLYPLEGAAVVLAEIMPNPEGTDGLNEFIELVNPAQNKTADLTGVQIELAGKTRLLIQPEKAYLAPGQRVLIHHPLYAGQSVRLFDGIEDTVHSVQAVTSGALIMRNTEESVRLISADGTVLDAFSWTSDPGNGMSWEQIIPWKKDQSNWGKSVVHHGTPGFENSRMPPETGFSVFLSAGSGSVQRGDSIQLAAGLVNTGFSVLEPGTLSVIRIQPGGDSVLQVIQNYPLPDPLDTVRIPVRFSADSPGKWRFFVNGRFGTEELRSGPVEVNVPFLKGDIQITEFFPSGRTLADFVELYNPSPDFSVALDGFQFTNSSLSGKMTLKNSGLILEPGGYGVLFRDTTGVHRAAESCRYAVVPDLPALKDTGDVIRVYFPGGLLADSLSWGKSSGTVPPPDFSSEKVVLSLPWSPSNCRISRDSGGTPGRINSRFPFKKNLALLSPARIVIRQGEVKTVEIQIENRGNEPENAPVLQIFSGNRSEPGRLLSEITGENKPITPDSTQSYLVPVHWKWSEGGSIRMVLNLADENQEDHDRWIPVLGSPPRGSLILTEILFDPVADSYDGIPDQSEYIEVWNPGTEPVQVMGWSISDRPTESGSSSVTIIREPLQILPGAWAVLAADSGFFSQFPDEQPSFQGQILSVPGFGFNADEDAVVLKDEWGSVIDSVFYSSKWHSPDAGKTKGKALERRSNTAGSCDPMNWTSSVSPAGGTPGRKNSVGREPEKTGRDTYWFTANPFSPDGDGHDDVCELNYQFSEPVSALTVTVFDRLGRKISTVKPWSAAGTTGVIFWDGKKEDGSPAAIGPYILLIEAISLTGSHLETEKKVVVLAKKL